MTLTQIQNYTVFVQDELATEVNLYTTNLANGKCIKYPNKEIIFAMIGQEILYQYDPDLDNNCLTEEQLCSIVAYIQKVIR